MSKQIGEIIRRLRKAKSITVQTLAGRTGLSKGYISKLENGHQSPPISTLSNIADALGEDMSVFFEHDQPKSRCLLCRKQDRRKLTKDSTSYGYDYEALPFGVKAMESFVMTITNDYTSDHRVSHEGEEMIYVLRGKMRFFHGEEVFDCEEGDSIYFDPSISHLAANLGDEPLEILSVVAPRPKPVDNFV